MNQDPNLTDAGGAPPKETPHQLKARISTHADNFWTLRNKLIVITTITSAVGLLVSLSSLSVALWLAKNQGDLREQDLRNQQTLREHEEKREDELRKQDFNRARLLKEIDIRQNSQKRYDDLAYDTKAKVKSGKDAEGYYKRFWDLQFEQYQYCKDGVIDQKIFKTWMDSRRREFRDDHLVGPMPYQEGWKYMSGIFIKNDDGTSGAFTEFVAFMNEVFDDKKKTCDVTQTTP